MSLEKALAENTAALIALTVAFGKGANTPAATPKPAADKKADPKPAAKAEEKPPVAETPKELTYDVVAAVVSQFVKDGPSNAKRGKDNAIAILKTFGLEKLTGSTAEQWPDILAAFNKANLETA